MAEQPNKPDWKNVEMGDRAREYYAKTFLVKYKQMQEDVETTPLVVLIWGPGAAGGRLYEKRVQIRGVLRNNGYVAVFSEEIDAECGTLHASAKGRELLQALNADFIVVIYSSPGSIAETHDFSGFQEIGPKMLIFIDSRHVDGYGFQGALGDLKRIYNNVHTFTDPQDIDECHLVARILERLSDLRWIKWQSGRK